jgi:signal transduction histidine kinase
MFITPLITRSKVIGILVTYSNGADVLKETHKTLRIFAPQIAIAIENARLYKIMEEQLQQLEKSHAMLSRADRFAFLSNLSEKLAQDIKEPIKTIGKFIRLLPDKFDDEEFRNDFYDIALEAANRVNNLISELLSLVRTKETQFEMVDFHDLIERTIFMVSPYFNSKRIEIAHHFDPEITYAWIDAEKMKQVLLNIISNAVDFTPTEGKIEIITENFSENGSQSICIKIKDNGIGINENVLNKIFDPYFSTKSDDGNIGSGGLGLFVALQNIQDHKGTIDVESRKGGGTMFIIKIPVNSH